MPIFGTLAMIASLAVVIIGLPHQIYTNWRRKSCEGISPSLIYASCFIYPLWALYGWTKPDPFIIFAQTPGSILAFILLFQLLYYGNRARAKS